MLRDFVLIARKKLISVVSWKRRTQLSNSILVVVVAVAVLLLRMRGQIFLR